MNSINNKTFCLWLLLATLTVVYPQAIADYWSLGAFRVEENAARERDRLSAVTGMNVELSQSGNIYRVVIEKGSDSAAQKETLEDLGLSPWLLSKNPSLVTSNRATKTEAMDLGDGYLLVLASFTDDVSAGVLLEKLRDDGIDPVAVIRANVNGTSYYRVVQGPFDTKAGVNTDYSRYGIDDAWWMVSRGLQVASVPAYASAEKASSAKDEVPQMETVNESGGVTVVSIPDVMPKIMQAEETEPVYVMSPPAPGESYIDYCLKRANKMERTIYCSDAVFNRIATVQRRIEEGNSAKLNYCALHATRSQRKQLCEDPEE
ncbi:MAG TPA: SPOR domain-containing protein [Gammaproteobacteria bacterium]|nr:SPOR domain-containing protein [Gammaproteobacteria bacterium]